MKVSVRPSWLLSIPVAVTLAAPVAHADDRKPSTVTRPAGSAEAPPASAELQSLQAETERLTKQIEVLNKRVALKEAERKARLEADLGDARERTERARVANDLALAEQTTRKRELDQREAELKVKTADLQAQKAELDLRVAKLNADLDLREKRDQWKNRVNAERQYTKEPFKDGVLTISDRRIALNGLILPSTAEQVAERIQYFNNQSHEYPIFIVIDESPGGAVDAGFDIVKTMQGSAAPVYVVVKRHAASMAACITTLAKRSFAYPNAIILHHQMHSPFPQANGVQHRENIKDFEEKYRRLAMPVAAKMGISLDELVKRMYQHRSTGDQHEYADAARKLKWVDEVVDVIRDESYVRNPDAPPSPFSYPPARHAIAQTSDGLVERADAGGNRYVHLPRLGPFDAWYLYDPDGYYRSVP